MTDRAEPLPRCVGCGEPTTSRTDDGRPKHVGCADRAEPGVTPDLTYEETTRLARAISQADHVNWPSRVVAEKIAGTVRAIIEARSLDAATPRPGLVEALERYRRAYLRVHSAYDGECEHGFGPPATQCPNSDCDDRLFAEAWDSLAALASGTGEPGLDVERLARAEHASYAREPGARRIEWDDLTPNEKGMWRRHAAVRAAEYTRLANDKGADPTPEPK